MVRQMRKWKKFQKGAVVCVIDPSYILRVSISEVEYIIRQNYLTPYIYPNISVPGNHSLYDEHALRLANTDEMRAMHFKDAMNNPECKIVWGTPGGYGAIRLIKYILNEPEPESVKLFMGFSDITLLHLFIQKKWEWPTIHYGMPGALGLNQTLLSDEAKKDIGDILLGSVTTASFSLSQLSKNTPEGIKGIVSGGNILTFSRSFGTEIQPDLADKILVFEELLENQRKIDGMLTQLQLLRDFAKVSAVVFGDLTGVKDEGNIDGKAFDNILDDFALNSGVPVFRLDENDTIGHGKEINRPLPMGTEATIVCDPECKMVVETGVSNIQNEDL